VRFMSGSTQASKGSTENRKVPGATSNRRLTPECRWFRTVAAALYPFGHSVAMIGSAGWGLDQRASSARLGTSSAEGSVPSRPHLPGSPAGFAESWRGIS
jgi:hypothetical protein